MCGWNWMQFHETVRESVKFYSAGFIFKGASHQNWSDSKICVYLILNDCRGMKISSCCLEPSGKQTVFTPRRLLRTAAIYLNHLAAAAAPVLRFTPVPFRWREEASHRQASIKTPVRWSYTVSRMTKHSDIMLLRTLWMCLRPLNHGLSHIWREALEQVCTRTSCMSPFFCAISYVYKKYLLLLLDWLSHLHTLQLRFLFFFVFSPPSVLTALFCQSGLGNYRFGHTSSLLQRPNQRAVYALSGHKAAQLSPGSLSKLLPRWCRQFRSAGGLQNMEEWAS